ncbi:MAG: DUF4263 domain-containing protein [Bacteroidales bacterium]|nr:DUF4263 domain-containing protein [Candidatus Latescibacterota bacterium]
MLDKSYKIEIGPKPISMEDYSTSAQSAFKLLLDSGPEEDSVQKFLEKNPAMVPGAFPPGAAGGHSPWHCAVVSQPVLPGLNSKIPDFMWIASNSQVWYPVLVEIEAPTKLLYKGKGVPRAEFTQAKNQLSEWRTWFSDQENVQVFAREYGLPDTFIRYRQMKLHMILVYGRREEFKGNTKLEKHRASIVPQPDEELVSFDRLRVDRNLTDVITVKAKGAGTYEAKHVSPTFTTGPKFPNRFKYINGFESALGNSEIADDRRVFLLDRIRYWREWVNREGTQSVRGFERE